ncbi:hypothetical protein JCM11641_005780 [Rhodosporidiobolus odoratus]
MAARKLQTEIDKTLKKVAEGVEVFESIFDKIQTSTNQTQKEKLESDLKTQIKKLQRLRDQIKTWMASNDIKDKQPLVDNRKLIETQMERFKACEKEMKTKAFSKEGLSAAAKLDPKEQQKLEMGNWLGTMVEELSRQVEQAEAEVETIQSVRKKKDYEREARLEELERLNERRSWHINRLELILRLLENGNLPTDSVASVKDDIAYFVESNTEEDFEEDEGIYDELNLEDEEDTFQMGQEDHQSSHDSVSVADEPAPPVPPIPRTPAKPEAKKEEEKPKIKAVPAPSPTKKPSLDATPSRPSVAPTTTPSRSVSGASAPAPRATPAPPLPPIRYAAAAAAANVSSPSTAPAVPSHAAPAPPPGLSAPSPAPAPVVTPQESTKSVPPEPASHASSAAPSPGLASSRSPEPSTVRRFPSLAVIPIDGLPFLTPQAPSQAPATPAPGSSADAASPAPAPSEVPSQAASSHQSHSQPSVGQSQQQSKADQKLPSSLADLVTSFESAKQKTMRREQDLGAINQILEAGFSNVPQPLDAEKPKQYVPRNPYATPTYYPQEPSSQFASPALFSKLDVDTLFYIFYYCPGTYLQYLAAAELKKQSWRFHKQYLTWFQRANEPATITDTYEQGVYLYFDWEGSWCQRRKGDFKFSYQYLEQ